MESPLRAFFHMDPAEYHRKSEGMKKENAAFYRRLKAKPPKNLDDLFHSLHEEVFEETDCLKCANCCKTTSPIFYPRDIDRAAAALKMKPGDFMERYLKVDEDKDYVLQKSPCAFLRDDNNCSIYESRPNACREYPHTDRKKIHQILDLTMKNTLVCPAVFEMTERLKKILK